MALAIRTHIIPQLLRNNLIVCLHFLIYKLPTNTNGCVLVGWCDVSECADSSELPPMLHTWQTRHGQLRVTGNIETELNSENNNNVLWMVLIGPQQRTRPRQQMRLRRCCENLD